MKRILWQINPLKVLTEIRGISFYDGAIKPFFDYYKVKPVNNYWDFESRTALKYRLVMLLCILTIVNCYYLINNKLTFERQIEIAYAHFYSGAKELSKDFPLRIYSYVHYWYSQKKDLSENEFKQFINNEDFSKAVSQLILNDKKNGSAELGGIILLQEGKVKFLVLESAFAEIASEIKRILEINRLSSLDYLRFKDEIEKRFGDDLAIAKLSAILKNNPSDVNLIRRFLMHAVFLSNYSYFLDFDSVMELFYGPYQGEYIGNFHVHRYGDPVSDIDLEGSKIEDKFVIISQGKESFQFVWLKNGEIKMATE